MAAGVAVWLGWRAHKSEQAREDEQRAERIAEGRRVFAWGVADGRYRRLMFKVYIQNGTSEPLHNIAVTLLSRPEMKLTPMGTTVPVVAPGQTYEWADLFTWGQDFANPPLYVLVQFRDRDGILCQRHPDGTLTVGAPQAPRLPQGTFDGIGS